MRIKRMTLAALAWAGLVAGAHAQVVEKQVQVLGGRRAPALQPGPQVKAATATVAADPTEPPLHVELSNSWNGGRIAGAAAKAEVVSSARGTVVKVPSQGQYSGTATLTFKNAAPPMRFTTQLTGAPNFDLSSLSLTSGTLTLQVGSVGTSETTKYFDAKGQEQAAEARAAYTVRAKRGDNGVIEIELRRGAGAALGRTLSVSWQSNLYNNMKGRLRGG